MSVPARSDDGVTCAQTHRQTHLNARAHTHTPPPPPQSPHPMRRVGLSVHKTALWCFTVSDHTRINTHTRTHKHTHTRTHTHTHTHIHMRTHTHTHLMQRHRQRGGSGPMMFTLLVVSLEIGQWIPVVLWHSWKGCKSMMPVGSKLTDAILVVEVRVFGEEIKGACVSADLYHVRSCKSRQRCYTCTRARMRAHTHTRTHTYTHTCACVCMYTRTHTHTHTYTHTEVQTQSPHPTHILTDFFIWLISLEVEMLYEMYRAL